MDKTRKRRSSSNSTLQRRSLTLDQVARLKDFLDALQSLETEVKALGTRGWVPKYLRRSGTTLYWSWWYEFSLAELLAFAMHATDLTEQFLEIVKSDEVYTRLIQWPDKIVDPAGRVKRRQVVAVLSLFYAVLNSVKAIGYHSVTIHELVMRGLSGDPVALRQAVAIDPSVLSMPSVADHICVLQLNGASRELGRLYMSAAKGPNKQLQPYWSLRYLERVLSEGRVLESHSKEEIYELMTQRLKLYDARGRDPFKGLFTTFGRWHENATT